MKKIIIYKLLQKLRAKPDFLRRVWIFGMVGVFGILMSGALLLWAGFSAINYAASTASHFLRSSVNQEMAINCWGKTQSLFAVQPWLERPALDNLEKLKLACFSEKPAACQGEDCSNVNNQMNDSLIQTQEGSFI